MNNDIDKVKTIDETLAVGEIYIDIINETSTNKIRQEQNLYWVVHITTPIAHFYYKMIYSHI